MVAITTKNITLPKEVAQQVVTKARDTSTIAALSPSTPMLFKDMTHVLFSREPEAEFVGDQDGCSLSLPLSHGVSSGPAFPTNPDETPIIPTCVGTIA